MSIWHKAKFEDIEIDEEEKTVDISFEDYSGEANYLEVPIEDVIKALAEAGYVEATEEPEETPTT